MRFLFETAVLPYLRDECGIRDVILVRILHAAGEGESVIGERIADLMQSSNPTLGISAKQARYELRIAARAESTEQAQVMIDALETTLRERLGNLLMGDERLEQQIFRLLDEQNLTLALYEGHRAAPIYNALNTSDISLERLQGVMIHPLDKPGDEAAAAALAHAGAVSVQNRWRTSLALGIQVVATPDASGFHTICLNLLYPGGSTTTTQHYDLRQPEGWQIVGTIGLNMLRSYLLQELA
jgi:plasmid stabilization system protein ParE